jgi:hypothetical protein
LQLRCKVEIGLLVGWSIVYFSYMSCS